MVEDSNSRFEKKRRAIELCRKEFELPENPAINDELLIYEGIPDSSSKKLAFLILAYKREATTSELKKISDQPAGLVKALRNDGFLFQHNGKQPRAYFYRNSVGETCRKIVGFKSPKIELRGRVKSLLEKSVAACISAIEIYNKPDFKYREETFSILLINAWELLLKAKVLSDSSNQLRSIQAFDREGQVKTNRSGNPLTIDIYAAINGLSDQKQLDIRCQKNLELLIEIRDNAIHFINKDVDLSKKVQEIGTASLKNYITVIGEWFGRDLSQYNFYLMPMSFFHPTEIDSFSVKSHEKESERMLAYFRHVESSFPPEEDQPYFIALQIQTKFVKTFDASTLEVKYTDRDNAPGIMVSEENIFKTKYPLTYTELVKKLQNRYSDFKPNGEFYALKKELEDPEQYGEKFCRVNYLNVLRKTGSQQKFYSSEIIKEFDKHYTRKKS